MEALHGGADRPQLIREVLQWASTADLLSFAEMPKPDAMWNDLVANITDIVVKRFPTQRRSPEPSPPAEKKNY